MKLLMITAFPPMKAPEADHAFHLAEHLAGHALDVHVVTTKDSIAVSHSGITVHPIMRDWSWSDFPRLVKCMTRCSPDAILLVYIGWIYNYHPMLTFVPTVAKTFLPHVRFVTLFEGAGGAFSYPPSLLGRAARKGRELWKNVDNDFGTRPRPYRLVRVVRKGMELWAGRKNGNLNFRTLLNWPYPLVRVVRKGMELWAGRKNTDFNFGTLLRDSDRIIAVSDQTRAGLAERFSGVNSKSVLIPAPPIMRMCPENDGEGRRLRREALGLRPNDFLVVYFGYIYPGKGVETLLKAFRIVSAQRGNVRLLMVGGSMEFPNSPSYSQEIRGMPKQLGIDDRVAWTGEYAWDSDEASGYLRAADVCVLPFDMGVSVHNSSFAAAAAHGLAIITTRGETLEEPFVHQQNVLLCPPRDPEAMAAAIETLMDGPDIRKRLQRGACELAREWFSWERVIERTVSTLSAVIS